MDGRRILIALLILPALGCGRGADPPFPTHVPKLAVYVPQEGASNAFDGYALAALEAERAAPRYLNEVNFLPTARKNAMVATRKAVSMAASATAKTCRFEYTPLPPFEAAPYQRGWRLIGRCFVWNIEQALANGDATAAIRNFSFATKFGWDLTGGSAIDASLGYTLVNEARLAILKGLDGFSASELENLAAAARRALDQRPRLDQFLEHERLAMLSAVDYVQDCYRRKAWDELSGNLMGNVRPAVDYLRNLEKPDKRAQYFEGFADEAEQKVAWLQKVMAVPTADRKALGKWKPKEDRPWRRFSVHFFTSAESLIPVADITLARTRLLAVYCLASAKAKLTGAAPQSLEFAGELATDPYTGKPFPFRSEGRDFRVHSVGADGKDDGGDTNSLFDSPDVTLELP